ncbi:MAG: flagellar motor switch protein FliM [Deltaproteobacteria bacterium]|nr:flagellar motor switch protein FliM [Deltaproteobacteria bacterium]
MAQILSQEEVDALLGGVSTGRVEAETGPRPEGSGVAPYDFANQDRMVSGRLPTLDIINERLARLLRVSLSGALQKIVNVAVPTTDVRKFGDFLKQLGAPTSYHILRAETLRGFMLLALDADLVFSIVETYFGGSVRGPARIQGREFTAIEHSVIRKIVHAFIQDMERAWKAVHPLNLQLLRSEVNQQFVGIVPAGELVLLTFLEVALEEPLGHAVVCLPFSTIEPIRGQLQAVYQSDQAEVDEVWLARLEEQLAEATVEVAAELGSTRITGRELLGLQPGDVITLRQGVEEEIMVRVEGVPKLLGRPGLHHGNKAVMVTARLAPATRRRRKG